MNRNTNMQALLGDKEHLQQLAQSQEARTLMGMLTQNRDQASLQQAAQKAARGDTGELTALIQSVMKQPEGAKLLEALSKKVGK